MSPDNQVELSDFVIDDVGLTGSNGFPLLDMKGKLKDVEPKMAFANNESSFSPISLFHFHIFLPSNFHLLLKQRICNASKDST